MRIIDRFNMFGITSTNIITLISISVFATTMEAIGLSIFLPIFQYIRFQGDTESLIENSQLWESILLVFNELSIGVSLLPLLLIAMAFFLVRQALVYFRIVYVTSIVQGSIKTLRNEIFDKYLTARSSYHETTPAGALVNIISVEARRAIVGVITPIELLVLVIMAFGYLIMLLILSWQMTLVAIMLLLVSTGVPQVWIKRSAFVGRKLTDANMSMSSFLVSRLKSPRLVRLCGTENAEKKEFEVLTNKQRKHMIESARLKGKTETVIEPLVLALSLSFLYFSYSFLAMEVELIGLYLLVVMRLLPILKATLVQWQSVQNSLGAIEVIEERLRTLGEEQESDVGVYDFREVSDSIEFNNVSYYYPGMESKAVERVSFLIPANKMTAIVGPSGGGKSTLVDMLPNLRGPTEGHLLVDGVDVCSFSLNSLRKSISFAPQNPQVFSGSVKSHIGYGKPGASDAEISEAARLAGAEEFILKLPLGYDTLLGDDAVNLSGGQKQRLDLARALLKRPPVLILDEPSSNLDVKSEQILQQQLHQIQKTGKTTIIIIAHRLSNIINADQIVVINSGSVEATGTHQELLKRSGWYANAWKIQND